MQAFASNPQAGRDTAQMESDKPQMGGAEVQIDSDEAQMGSDDTRFPVRSLERGLALSEVEQVRLRRWFVPNLSDSPLQTIDSTVCDS